MKRLSLVMLVMIVALGLSRLGVQMLPAASPLAPANFIVPDSPKPLPEIVFADGEGKAGSLADFRGKFVLLNIWATWCVPCRKEMPTLDRLQAKLGGPDFEVIALSIDRGGADAVRKFYADVGVKNLAITLDARSEAPFRGDPRFRCKAARSSCFDPRPCARGDSAPSRRRTHHGRFDPRPCARGDSASKIALYQEMGFDPRPCARGDS